MLSCLGLGHLHLICLAVAPLVSVCASSGSPYLLHPSLSLCFPTVIDNSLQSLTAAHQHLLRGNRERSMSAGERLACDALWERVQNDSLLTFDKRIVIF